MKIIGTSAARAICLAISFALAGTSLALSPATAQQSQPSEEKVFLDYTQAELDKAYDQRAWAPNAGKIIKSWGSRSEETRTRYSRDTYKYGPSKAETLDVFSAGRADAPTLIFIHGGAWRAGSKDAYSFLADAFVPYGANLVILNFDNIPDARLPEMAEQVRRAIAWTYENAAALGVDPDKLYVTGHSSGGHLTGVMLTTDWTGRGLPANLIKGGIPVSGMFDLEPVMLSARSDYIRINDAEEAALSPIRHLHKIRAPIIIAYGGKETPEFQRHSREFRQALKQTPYQAELVFLPELNHFEMMNDLADPNGEVARAARRLMGLVGEGK
jgi:arylformamidase